MSLDVSDYDRLFEAHSSNVLDIIPKLFESKDKKTLEKLIVERRVFKSDSVSSEDLRRAALAALISLEKERDRIENAM